MSRFARHCRVIYVNPVDIVDTQAPHIRNHGIDHAIHLREAVFPTTLLDTPGNSYRELWLRLLPEVLDEAGPNTILWVLSPLANYLVEAALPHVDLVFTGGRALYEARKDRHPRVHCFPSGVDLAHYQRVCDPVTLVPADMDGIPRPRLGYFGVLDERIDWTLISEIAHQRREWQWVFVGPTVKVRPAELPTGTNIHYLGQRSYGELPAYLKGFDIATMPFALNEATRYISPTKTPEYLAGGKPVISTSVPDVVTAYKNIICIADGVDGWIDALEELLSALPDHTQTQIERAQPHLTTTSWDSIVERMWSLMQEQIRTSH
jgi:glycosyltransferase involved in cell wall biosynthesis